MTALLILGSISFILCFLLTPLCRNASLKLGWVDLPDDERKFHARPIPRTGGIAIVCSYLAAFAFLIYGAPRGITISIQHQHLLWSLLPATGLIFAIGVVDDLFRLRAWQKLIFQLIAAVWAVSMGVRIPMVGGHALGGHAIGIQVLSGTHVIGGADWITFFLSVCWLVGCTNAFNLVDGLDGLASGVGLFATLTTLLAALLQGNMGLAIATVPLAGCLLAFLFFNFSPASIFLGDSGSLTIGFLLGCFAVIWSQKSATLLGMLAPLTAFAFPLLEVAISISRRWLRSQPIFQPDRGHIHHRLLKLGFRPYAVALILYCVCGIAAMLSLLQSSMSNHLGGIIVLVFCLLTLLGIRSLDYAEFSAATKIIKQGLFFHIIKDELFLSQFREQLSLAHTPVEYWSVLRNYCRELNISRLTLAVAGNKFEEGFDHRESAVRWEFWMTLKNGSLSVVKTSEGAPPAVLLAFLAVFQQSVETKKFCTEITKMSDHEVTGVLTATAGGR